MTLAPALLEHDLGIIRMEIHVHASIAVMNVANLASAGGIDGVLSEESKTFLLET